MQLANAPPRRLIPAWSRAKAAPSRERKPREGRAQEAPSPTNRRVGIVCRPSSAAPARFSADSGGSRLGPTRCPVLSYRGLPLCAGQPVSVPVLRVRRFIASDWLSGLIRFLCNCAVSYCICGLTIRRAFSLVIWVFYVTLCWFLYLFELL